MLPTLREYQEPCVKQGLYFFNSTRIEKPRLLVAPTAAGKSIIIAAIASGLHGRKVLVIQPSVELLTQNYNKYLLYDQDVSLFSASVGQKKLAKVVFGTIGTLIGHPDLFSDFECLIIDEAHLYPASQESMFGSFCSQNPQLKILGLTATPFRLKTTASGSKLVMMHNSNIYCNYQHIIQIKDIAPKYWAKIDYIFEKGKANLLKVNTTGAEYTDKSLELYGKSVEEAIKKMIEAYPEKSMLLFVPSVKQAEELSLKDAGSGFVCGSTNKSIRKKLIDDFKSGKIKRVYNFGVLGVGFDFPGLEILIDAVPTLSLAKHYQKVGRLTRPHPEGLHIRKTYIDIAGNTKRFGYMEDLEIRKVGTTYHVFSGERQITNRNLNTMDMNDKPEVKGSFDNMTIPFGRFKGLKINQAEKWWLSWAMDNLTGSDKLVKNIKLYLMSLKEEEK